MFNVKCSYKVPTHGSEILQPPSTLIPNQRFKTLIKMFAQKAEALYALQSIAKAQLEKLQA